MTENNSEPTKKPIEDEKVDSSNNFQLTVTKTPKPSIDQIDEPDIDPSQATPNGIYLFNSLQELIESERIEKKKQKNLRMFNVILIFIYIAVLVFILVYTGISNPQLKDAKIPFLDVPLWAIIWGAMGSLSAVLYRFYTAEKIKVSQETQWLIARPLIGILMSAVAYLGLRSGLITVNEVRLPLTDPTENVKRLTSIFCFIAGFSEIPNEAVYIFLSSYIVSRCQASSGKGGLSDE